MKQSSKKHELGTAALYCRLSRDDIRRRCWNPFPQIAPFVGGFACLQTGLTARSGTTKSIRAVWKPRKQSAAIRIEPVIVAPFVALPFLFILLLVLLFGGKKKETRGGINHGKRNRRD